MSTLPGTGLSFGGFYCACLRTRLLFLLWVSFVLFTCQSWCPPVFSFFQTFGCPFVAFLIIPAVYLFYLLLTWCIFAVNRGVHSSYENLSDMYPIQNRKVFDRLQGLCSQLTHWAPILAEVSVSFVCFCRSLREYLVAIMHAFNHDAISYFSPLSFFHVCFIFYFISRPPISPRWCFPSLWCSTQTSWLPWRCV